MTPDKTQPLINKPIIWTISGSDCSGGAGIAADIKTGHVLGCEVCHLSTANTVQNSNTLTAINPVESAILAAQAELLLTDKPPQAVKIGLLASSEQLTWLIDFLTKLKSQLPTSKVIYDPVGQASVGGKFASFSFAELTPLLPLVDIITPNTQEAKQLATLNHAWLENQALAQNNGVENYAQAIAELGVNSVLIKGGHGLDVQQTPAQCFDYCLHQLTDFDSSKMSQDESIVYGLLTTAIDTHYSHGGGCSLASAIAAFSAHGYLVRDAITLAKAFINQGLAQNQGKHDHYGAFEQTAWPNNANFFPNIISPINTKYQTLEAFNGLGIERDGSQSLGLYPVIDSLYWLERLLPLGLKIIQLRIKNKSDSELNEIIKQAVALNQHYPNTRLFINDYWQLAIKHGAYGVHIGQEDLMAADLAQIQQAGLRLGISTHGCYEFLLAQQLRPSYLAVGAIFPTKTKDMTGQIQGITNLKQCLMLSTDIPVVAIGGINHQRAVDVWATGVDSIAVVTAITEADSPENSVEQFKSLFNQDHN